MSTLNGKRILIVEDEYLIAQNAADMLEELGAIVIGPASTVAEALDAIAVTPIDAAMLDVNLHGVKSDPIADALRAKGVRFLLASGYMASPGDEHDPAILGKPYSLGALKAALQELFDGPAR